MRLFIIAMPGCGNLGDDLISQILVHQIDIKVKAKEIGILCGEESISLNYENIKTKIHFFKKPRRISFSKYFGRSSEIQKFLKSTDLIIIGGGGLFQDSHSFFTIHNYLKFLQYANSKIIITGVGVGPINSKVNKIYLRFFLNHKNITIQVRDLESKILLEDIGVVSPIILNTDIVEGASIHQFINFKKKSLKHSTKILGCNIRKWPDINVEKLLSFLKQLVDIYNFEQIKFFVFENGIKNESEKRFANLLISEVIKMINIEVSLNVYNETPINQFYTDFFNVNYAVASRYHANILWQKAKIPTIPISYAPKVNSLYRKYRKPVFNFNELLNQNCYSFNIVNEIYFNENYILPEVPSSNVKLKLRLIILFKVFNFIEFIYNSFKSILIRLR